MYQQIGDCWGSLIKSPRGVGFALAAIMVLLGTAVVGVGLPFYRHQKPTGSPVTRILQVHSFVIIYSPSCYDVNKLDEILAKWRYKFDLLFTIFLWIAQVFVAAFRKRKLPALLENLMEIRPGVSDGTGTSVEVMERTAGFE